MTDGWVLLQVAGQPMFKRWCRLVGREDLFDDPRFADDDLRCEHGDVLNDVMQEWCDRHDAGGAHGELLEAAKLPAAPLASPQDVLDDPHVAGHGLPAARAFPGAVASGADHRDTLPHVEDARRDHARERRCSVSTPTRSSPRSATRADEIAELRAREII